MAPHLITSNSKKTNTLVLLLQIFLLLHWSRTACTEIIFLGQQPFRAYISLASIQGQTIYQLYAVELPTGVSNAITYRITQNSRPPLFQVLPQTGQLQYTSGSLALTQYTLTVSAMSNTQSADANVTVIVIIESDSTPRFEQAEYIINVPEDIPVDAAFSIVRAFSPNTDTTASTYSIVGGNTDSDITIESTTGLLRANRALDRERTDSYTLAVRYVSGASPIDTAVNIHVLDINDNSPQFSESFYNISIPETTGSFVVNASATDRDLGDNGTLSYSLDPSASSTFSLDATTGRVMVIASLDYECQPQYYFTVTAMDDGSPPTSTTVTILVNLMNIDDECPQFENPVFISEVQYDPDNNAVPSFDMTLVTVKAYDPDGLGAITYSLESPTSSSNVLALNNMTGVISLSRIDPSIRGLYILNVSASDNSCIRQSFVPVEIAIGSRNGHSPQFPSECTATMYENPPLGTEVVTLNAVDEDIGVNGIITYSLLTQTGLFTINPSSGTVSTIASPSAYNRENQSQFYVDVIARDGGNRQDYCQLTITLLDRNDNSPQILLQNYDTTVQLNVMSGTFVIQIEATDSDNGVNGSISYSLISHNDGSSLPFAIDPESGIITTNGTLSSTTYIFDVVVTDMGEPLQLSSTAVVSITVASDLSFPVFTQAIYSGEYGENIAQGTRILTVTATSSNPNDPILYDIVSGSDYRSNVDIAFRITTLASGGADISVGSTIVIDYERLQPTSSFSFFVRATNGAGSSIAAVKINITDVDDSSPEFLSNDYSIFLAENEPIGTTVLRLQATDPDSGTNGDINYRLFFPSTSFNVTREGIVLSNQLFDSENPTQAFSGIIVVEAFNPNNPQVQRTSLRLPWTVVDVNDNQLSFVQFTYSATLPENQALRSVVLTLEATDPDSSNLNNLQYFITEGNDGTFEIDSNNIILARRLDFENITSYNLQVQVTDGQQTGCTQCLATVSVHVTDVDDEPPVFTQPVYQTQVTENAPIGTFLVNISATDSDSATVHYVLLGLAVGRFAVDINGGITVSGQIDREDFLPDGELVFLVLAEGGGLATAEIHVTITDVNDNAPRFTETFRGQVHENISPEDEGIGVVQVQAFDLDAGRNGSVTYSLIDGEVAGFRINPNLGLITSHAVLDREAQSSYTITVQATDDGLPTGLSSTTKVTIDIGDDNDNRPFFPFLFMFARVFENTPTGTHVITIPATDLDYGTNATITYNLLSFIPSEMKFELNSETGEVTVSGSLDYEIPLHRIYTLVLSISDPQFQAESEGTLVIQLLDQNDNAPVVQEPQYALLGGFSLSETLPAEEQIIVARINASDEDSGLNSELVFEISGGNENEVFSISDENGIGVIRNVRQLDHETTPRYQLLITVSDRGTPPKSTTVELPFRVIDVNDEPPVFNQSSYTVTVEENSDSQVSILQLNATDPDTGSGGNISAYNIEAGNDGGWFILDPTQGTLETAVSFDREVRSSYTLTVTAVDDGGMTAQTGTASVLILISDVNDNPSLFDGVLYIHIYALDGRAPTGPITVPNFLDPDVNNSFTACRVRFQSSELTQLFAINEVNCIFSLTEPDPPEDIYNFQYVGRDGVFTSVYSNISVMVDHIRSADIPADNLVTVTVNASAEEYFSERLNISFPLLIAGAIGVDQSLLRIVSVHPGYHDPDRSVDITFIAQNTNSVYINPTAILSQLFLKRNNLVIGEYSIIALPTDPCVSEPCFNQAACKSLQMVRPTEQVARSKEFVLLAPRIELSYECECVPGTSGRLCEINYDDCYSNPCMQNAQCFDEVGGFQCDCPEGSSGPDCGFNPDECIGDPCMNGATCVNGLNSYVCECLPGYYGRECQYRYYKQSAACSDNPCRNGATCSPGRDTFTCVCPVGFSGQLCEMEEQAQGGCLRNPCYNGSTCTDTLEGPVCTCSVGFTGPNCLFPLNNCELQPCKNDGICQQGLYGSYRCLCAPEFTGDNCSVIIAACDSNPCRNGGRCLNQIDGTYTCECTRYFHGVNCDIPLLPPDLCNVEPCSPNATCTSGKDDFTCTCMTGYSGRDCSQEVNDSSSSLSPCDSNPCKHGGTCNDMNGSVYSCTCSVGFTGENCQTNINDCAVAAEPCLNGGVCLDGVGGFVCNCSTVNTGRLCEVFCPDGQEGEFCETRIQYCSEERCLNGGTCIEEMGGFKCACSPGYTGATCEVIHDCSIIECLNRGVCVEATAGVYQCDCRDGFEGPNCELLTVSFSGTSSQGSYRAYDSLEVRGQGNISFQFATRERDGLLLYNTQYQGGESVDFIAVEIVGGLLRVGVSQGDDSTLVSVMSSTVSVSDGQWHQVRIETSGQVGLYVF